MAILHETVVTLRFYGDELNPDELTRILGAVPTEEVRKSGIWITPGGVEKTAKIGRWLLRVEQRSTGGLDGQISELLSALTSDLSIWRSLTLRYQADVFCGLFLEDINEGLVLSPETLAALGSRGLSLGLDVYSMPRDED